MKRRTFLTGAAGSIALTAGCMGALGGASGTIRFYVSDQPNAIGDFESLDVTVSSVAFKPAGEGEEDADDGSDGNESDASSAGDRAGWETFDVDDPTVDLTQLQGPKATLLDEFEVSAGDYVAADLFVSDVQAVLTDGTEANLEIPSDALRIRTNFTVEDGGEVDFVYDIAPTKAGDTGEYVLTPVISESGTEAEIEEVDAKRSDNESA